MRRRTSLLNPRSLVALHSYTLPPRMGVSMPYIGVCSATPSETVSVNECAQQYLQKCHSVGFVSHRFSLHRLSTSSILFLPPPSSLCPLHPLLFPVHPLSAPSTLSLPSPFSSLPRPSQSAPSSTVLLELLSGLRQAQVWVILMRSGGHFAGAVFRG